MALASKKQAEKLTDELITLIKAVVDNSDRAADVYEAVRMIRVRESFVEFLQTDPSEYE